MSDAAELFEIVKFSVTTPLLIGLFYRTGVLNAKMANFLDRLTKLEGKIYG